MVRGMIRRTILNKLLYFIDIVAPLHHYIIDGYRWRNPPRLRMKGANHGKTYIPNTGRTMPC